MTREISLRTLREDDLPTVFDIQLDETAQHMSAFNDNTARDRDAFLQKRRGFLPNKEIIMKVIEINGEVVGTVGVYPMEGETQVTYWIRKDLWGQGIATAALAALLKEVTMRPIYSRAAQDNIGSIRVMERNGFVLVGSEESFALGRQATITELMFKLSN